MDEVTSGPVALKFFDPDLQFMANPYREEAFYRECELLTKVKGRERYLQLVKPLTEFPLSITTESNTLRIPCRYFATEWLGQKINMPFAYPGRTDALARLALFRELLLAVGALHRLEIFHRDLKPDNFGVADRPEGRRVVAIDFGTAFSIDSPQLGTAGIYDRQVGAIGYAPLEAQCGLSSVRTLGRHCDMYALGCLLFELFSDDYFYINMLNSSGYMACRGACEAHMIAVRGRSDNEDRWIAEWGQIIARTKRQVITPELSSECHPVPASIVDILNRLVQCLTSVDYRDRCIDLTLIVRLVDSACRVLQNAAADAHARAAKAQRRQAHAEKLIRRQERVEEYLRRQMVLKSPS